MSEGLGNCPFCEGSAPKEMVPVFLGTSPNSPVAYVPVQKVRKAVNVKLRTGAPEGDKVAHESKQR